MADDNIFFISVILIAAGLIISKLIQPYGYGIIITGLKTIFTIILFYSIITILAYFYIKKVIQAKKEKDKAKHKPEKEIIPKKPKVCKTHFEKEKLSPKTKELKLIDINIELDPHTKFYNERKLNQHEKQYLKNKGFITRTYTNPFTKKKEKFVFKTNGNESETHAFMTQIVSDYLKKKVSSLKNYETVKPDIVFEHKGKTFAIEIETGKILTHNRKNLLKKIEILNKEYDKWIFIVTNRNLISKYRKYGKVLDPRYLKTKLKTAIDENSPRRILKPQGFKTKNSKESNLKSHQT